MLRSLRRFLRARYDALFCDPGAGVERLGGEFFWFVATRALTPEAVVYSAGVGTDISFEQALVATYGVAIELFDPSPTGRATMARPENQLPALRFTPVGLADRTGELFFSEPQTAAEGSFTSANDSRPTLSMPCADLPTLMAERGHRHIDLLKLDIEGFEYDVLAQLVRERLDVRQIALEFHHYYPWVGRRKTREAITLLKGAGYRLVHKNRNDYTFVRG